MEKLEEKLIKKTGVEYKIRMVEITDAKSLLEYLHRVHMETDFLMSYPDEIVKSVEEEKTFLKNFLQDEKQFLLCAFVGEKVIGSVGVGVVLHKRKGKHRASLGISVCKKYWGKGIGRKLMEEALQKIKFLEYEQVELGVFQNNERAFHLYGTLGFQEWGRVKNAFKQKDGNYQDEVIMGLFL